MLQVPSILFEQVPSLPPVSFDAYWATRLQVTPFQNMTTRSCLFEVKGQSLVNMWAPSGLIVPE